MFLKGKKIQKKLFKCCWKDWHNCLQVFTTRHGPLTTSGRRQLCQPWQISKEKFTDDKLGWLGPPTNYHAPPPGDSTGQYSTGQYGGRWNGIEYSGRVFMICHVFVLLRKMREVKEIWIFRAEWYVFRYKWSRKQWYNDNFSLEISRFLAISGKCLLTRPDSEYCLILLKKSQSIVSPPPYPIGDRKKNYKQKIFVKKTAKKNK